MTQVTVEEYISNLPPDLQAITRELAAVARKNMPGAHEFIYHNAVGYSVSESPFDRICYIALQRGYVNFGFFFGVNLPDPKHLLIGEEKRLRHVKVRSVDGPRIPRWEGSLQLHGKKHHIRLRTFMPNARKVRHKSYD